MPLVRSFRPLGAAVLVVAFASGPLASGDTITLKNGLVYKGTIDRDNTIIFVFDGLKRIILRDSKIAGMQSDTALRNTERFQLVQPLEVHGGTMPSYAMGIEAGPWDEFGRRPFSYIGPRSSKPVSMKQAIIELGPYMVKIRGVDGYWPAQLATSQVPRPVVLGLLAKVEQTNQNERVRVGRFLIQAEWYAEAKKELDRLEKDFPEVKERVQSSRQLVQQLEAEQLLAEISVRRKALQPKSVHDRLKSFPTEGISTELLVKVRDQLRADEAEVTADSALADSLQTLAGRLAPDTRKAWKSQLVEILAGLTQAPDAVRGRLDAFQQSDANLAADARFALALTGWLVGSDAALPDLAAAEKLWKAHDLLADYLRSSSEDVRADRLAAVQAIEWSDASQAARKIDPETT
ncbi:MAG TPA: alpha/beta hydrolase, partial [Isosphaeraceae bacterium]|nr:alpha/beta hydrolase [Isosphaeraceae bacterium]